jgi:hypothetical protein
VAVLGGLFMTPQEVMPVMRCHPIHGRRIASKQSSNERSRWLSPVVGLAGLEPAASSLSGFCPRACFRRIAPATCANDLPLETAGDRCEPLGSDGMWTKRGPTRGRSVVQAVVVRE